LCLYFCVSVWQGADVNALVWTEAYQLMSPLGCCNTLQHTATHCSTLQHTATHCNTLQHTARRCNMQHTATHCNIPQRTAPTHVSFVSFAPPFPCVFVRVMWVPLHLWFCVCVTTPPTIPLSQPRDCLSLSSSFSSSGRCSLLYLRALSNAGFVRKRANGRYGVATVSRIDKVIRLFCRILSLL